MSCKENDVFYENEMEQRVEREWYESEENEYIEVKDKIDKASTSYLDNQYYVYRDMVIAELPKEAHRYLDVLLLIHDELVTRRVASEISNMRGA